MSTPIAPSLDHLTNDELLRELRDLGRESHHLTVRMLAHLAEVDVRGAHRERACPSLFAYCVRELRMSEDEAQRRIVAARAARRFPVIYGMLEAAKIHLTGIAMLAPHLDEENHASVLARASFRSKREIECLVAELAPRRDVPARVQPIRVLPAGEGRTAEHGAARGSDGHAPHHATLLASDGPAPERVHGAPLAAIRGAALEVTAGPVRQRQAPACRYKIQFTAEQEYVDLLEEARDLLLHELGNRDIARVHLTALRALVEQLRKRRCGATTSRRSGARESRLPRGRHVPADVRRAVWKRDGYQCTFIDGRGHRCGERGGLELHHRQCFVRGGPRTLENLTLHRRAHNALAAERELGRTFMQTHGKGARRATLARSSCSSASR